MRILLAAGGTGGHVTPAIATAQAIVERLPSASIVFVADGRPVAEKFFSRVSFGREHLFPDHVTAPKKHELLAWWAAFRRARALLRDFEPDVIAGFGGYPTFVLGLAALGSPVTALLRAWLGAPAPRLPAFPSRAPSRPPLVLLEQNAHPGKAVRFLAKNCAAVLLAMPDAKDHLRGGVRSEVVGNPLPAAFTSSPVKGKAEAASEFGLDPGRPTLLVCGGSQGARGVNRLVLGARAELCKRFPDLQILFISGDAEFEAVRREVQDNPQPQTIVLPFEHRMRLAYECADVVVCRAGGTTLAELAIVGRPMVVVPYPYHRDRHQSRNAEAFARVGAARIVEEGEGAPSKMLEALTNYLRDPGLRTSAAAAARTLGFPDAADRAAKRILEIGGLRTAGDETAWT